MFVHWHTEFFFYNECFFILNDDAITICILCIDEHADVFPFVNSIELPSQLAQPDAYSVTIATENFVSIHISFFSGCGDR